MIAHINGIKIAYSEKGRGMPVVFLHAFPLNRQMWTLQEEALSTQFRTITIDLRGHGESDAPLWRFTLEHYADDVIGLLDHLSIEHAVIIGLSMGGYVALECIRKYADRVRALVLADTRAAADSPEVRMSRFHLAQTAFRQGTGAVSAFMLPKLLGTTSQAKRPALVSQVKHMIEISEVSGIVVDCMAMADRRDSVSLLSQIQQPTLVLVGDEDAATPPSEARVIADGIAGARLAFISRAGHLSNLEQPELFNQVVTDFLVELR